MTPQPRPEAATRLEHLVRRFEVAVRHLRLHAVQPGRSLLRPLFLLLVVSLFVCGPLLRGGATLAFAAGSDDPLEPFLKSLADSSDAYFGRSVVDFDTTGVDSLIRLGVSAPPPAVRVARTERRYWPIVGFHRATGGVLGLGTRLRTARRGSLSASGSYGFSDREGRYSVGLGWDLTRPESPQGGHLGIAGTYARETVPFAPEHVQGLSSTAGAFFTGRDRQSVFERRGGAVELTWSGPTWSAGVGWRGARDRSMPPATRFTALGARRTVPGVTKARPGFYREGFVAVATVHPGFPFLGIEGEYTARNRWRARWSGAQSVIVGPWEAHLQVEAGLAARRGPSQLRFALGGPLAVPSLGFGDGYGNRLALGKCELVHGTDVFRALRVPHPSFLAFHPAVFVHGGAAWVARDGSWTRPGRGAWRAAAGCALVQLLGVPSPWTYLRLQMAWPLGPDSGVPRFSVAIGRWHDLVRPR